MGGKWNICRKLWNILHFQHLNSLESILSGFRKKSDHILKSQILGEMGGKWEVNGTFAENYETFCTLNTGG